MIRTIARTITIRIACLGLIAAALTGFPPVHAADAAPADKPKTEKAAPAPVPIPVAQLAAEADAAIVSLQQSRSENAAQKTLDAVESDLPRLSRDVDLRVRENARILAQRPPLELLRDLDYRWQAVRESVAAAAEPLNRLIVQLDRDLERVDSLQKTWQATLELARQEQAPSELLQRNEALLAEIAATRRHIGGQRLAALRLQSRVSGLDLRASEALQANRRAREVTIARMLKRDSAALWDPAWSDRAGERITAGAGEAWEAQWILLRSYLQIHGERLLLHAVLLVLVTALLSWVRRRLGALVGHEPALAHTAATVEYPLASALVLTLMATQWIYPQAPRLLWAIAGVAMLVPAIVMLRRLVAPYLLAPLYAVLAFFVVDQFRTLSASIDILPRLLFLAEMGAATAFLGWLSHRWHSSPAAPAERRHSRTLRSLASFACALAAASVTANVAGYVALSNLVGNAVLQGMYAGLVLYAVVQILYALLEIATRVWPLQASGMIRKHRNLLQRRTRRVIGVAAVGLWLLHVLDLLAVRERTVDGVRAALDATLSLGQIDISLSAVLSFVLAVWAAFLVSRFVRFVLDEEIYPRTGLQRGVPYAISRTLHFLIVAVGFFVAMGVIGMEMTQFTILASAFTIGVGFGLQNIFNNFVSGLIVLFERPVQVGDVIQMDDVVGVVERIGIRASVVRTASSSEVIVPNGKLISDRVINWTLSGRKRVIELPLSVVLQSDPGQVIATLERVATEHPQVLEDPPPQALVTRIGPDWMGFELRAAIGEVEGWMQVRSELAVAAIAALREANIALR